MAAIKIAENIYWVGAVDWNIKHFHGYSYSTQRGTTYNAYLIIDDKITLIDGVDARFAGELIDNIKTVVDPAKIEYIVANHVEMDHSGALPRVHDLCPHAKLFGTAKCKDGLYKHYYRNWDFQVVKSGDKIKLGKRTLSFLEAPMIHWPDSMFTYIEEDALLMPNDAFGQHYATSKRFDDEVDPAELFDEAKKYYANILWPLSPIIQRKIEEVLNLKLPIRMIAPSHGVIWRKDPEAIIKKYRTWASNESDKKVVMIYETMWGSTAAMARKIADGIMETGTEVLLYDINTSDKTEIINKMIDAKGYIIGSSTLDNDLLSAMAGFLEFIKGLKPKKRIACAFGSYGWSGGAVKNIENELKECGVEVIQPGLGIQYVPDENELNKCKEFGKEFAKKL